MSIPPMTGGGGGLPGGGGRRGRRDITAHFIRFGVQLRWKDADKGLITLGVDWNRLMAQFKKGGAPIKEVDKGLEQLGKKARASGAEIDKAHQNLAEDILTTAGSADVARGAFKTFWDQLKYGGNFFQALIAGLEHFVSGMEKIGEGLKKSMGEDAFKMVEKHLTNVLQVAKGALGALKVPSLVLAGWVLLAKHASGVYDTFIDVFQLMTYNRKTLQNMAADFAVLAGRMFASADELRATAGAAFELGIRGKDLASFSEKAYKMGRILGLADSEAVDLFRNLQIMFGRGGQDDIDKTTIAMRLLQERTGATSRELLGVVDQIRTITVTFSKSQRQPFVENMMKLAAQFKMMKMDINGSIAQITKFFDISDPGARRLAGIFSMKLGMGVNEFIKGLKDGTVSVDQMAGAAEDLVAQFGQNKAALDKATGGAADFVYQLARGAEEARNQKKALDDMPKTQKTINQLFDEQIKATGSMATSWGRLKTTLGAVLAVVGAPLFNSLSKVFDITNYGVQGLLTGIVGVRDFLRGLPEWMKPFRDLLLIWGPLAFGIWGFLKVLKAVVPPILRLAGGLIGLSKHAQTLGTTVQPVTGALSKMSGAMGELFGIGTKLGSVFGAMSGWIGTVLGSFTKLLGVVGAIISAYQLLKDIMSGFQGEQREKGQGMWGAIKQNLGTELKYGAMGAAMGAPFGLPGMAVGAAGGVLLGAGVSVYKGAQNLETPSLGDLRGLMPMPDQGPQTTDIMNPMTGGASDAQGRRVSVEAPQSPVVNIHQSDVVNAIGDQTRALLLALRALGEMIATPSALEVARSRFGGNTDLFDRVTSLEVR